MKKNSKKTIITITIALSLIIFTGFLVNNYRTKTSHKHNYEDQPKPDVQEVTEEIGLTKEILNEKLAETRKNSDLMKVLANDYVVGDSNAKVLIIEYASLSCPHCAVFYKEAYERLKDEYISTGKVRFVFRDFPLNQQALVAGAVAECVARDSGEQSSEKYHEIIKILFKAQDSWAFDPKYTEKLETIMKLDGMGQDRFNSCINDKKIHDKILAKRMDASNSLKINSTPTFFINGEISEGYVDYITIKNIIDKKLKQ